MAATRRVADDASAFQAAGSEEPNDVAPLQEAEPWTPAATEPGGTPTFRVIARNGLVVRTGPGTEFPVFSSLPFGTLVSVLKRDGQWALVDTIGDQAADGFAFFAFLEEVAESQVSAATLVDKGDTFVPITRPLLQSIMDRCANTPVKSKLDLAIVADALTRSMAKAKATTRLREVAFLSQAVIETDFFRTFEEYLGAKAPYAPYYGRGIHQLTHRDTYAACSHALYGDDRLVSNPDLILNDMEVNVDATAWFWRDYKPFNRLADAGNIDEIIHRLYGGTVGSSNPKVVRSVLLRRSYYKTIGGLLDHYPA